MSKRIVIYKVYKDAETRYFTTLEKVNEFIGDRVGWYWTGVELDFSKQGICDLLEKEL